MKVTTGVKRLDMLLGGGLEQGSAVLVYGPPFLGKESLARRFFHANVKKGTPAIIVLTNASAQSVRDEIAASDPTYAEAEAKGLARYVDTYSAGAGAEQRLKHTDYLDSALDLNGITLAVNKMQADVIDKAASHVLVLDSISTLIAYSNAQTAFRFLQTLVGRVRNAGATGLYLMEQGMHTDAEVQMFKHLMTGFIEVREGTGGKSQLQVHGLGAPLGQGWIEYKFGPTVFEITGSFAAGRI